MLEKALSLAGEFGILRMGGAMQAERPCQR
jgi:hypothetical protein